MRPILSFCRVVLAFSPFLFTSAVQLLPPPPIPVNFTAAFIHNHTVPHQHPKNRTSALVIDSFIDPERNDHGFWHGPSTYLASEPGSGYVRLFPSDPDQNYHTELGPATCFDMRPYKDMYLHIVFSGSTKFSISLNQHNEKCDSRRSPFLETWDSVETERYARGNDIYVPLNHFNINQSRTVSISFHGFFSPETLTLYKVEIVPELPWGFYVPPKLETGKLFLHCTKPNSFAFGIDDGLPHLVHDVMKILEEEDILVTFFVVGAGLRDKEANFSQVYKEMLKRGHQIALHSDTHQQIEALDTVKAIDEEIVHNIETFQRILGIKSRYFRPPYGTVGARTRQRLAAYVEDPHVINWSVDVEDWLWAESKTPERQRDAFFRDVGRGGNLVVMHYLSPTTVEYFREFIRFVKGLDMDIMRVDQCVQDPDSPPWNPARNRDPARGRYRVQSNRAPEEKAGKTG
ncbi:polysaccharide deacetylase family protein [Aspergillus undulatus]|uniref:polysaccharide deacetylase family protein n=1 Tax=Aspergillus undulatus TaxID=1810928 RepID=UPI003CCCB73D